MAEPHSKKKLYHVTFVLQLFSYYLSIPYLNKSSSNIAKEAEYLAPLLQREDGIIHVHGWSVTTAVPLSRQRASD
jgi:hypothetical protein